MAVYVNNITINSGENFSLPLTILDSNGDIPLNLTGYAASAAIRKHAESSTKTADFVVGITSAAKGRVTLSLASTITSSIKEGRYMYDLLVISSANYKSIAVEGSVLVRSGISS
jgi:hypothetical protein